MTTDSPEFTFSLPQKFHAFYELFAQFNQGAAEMHSSLPVHDEPSRAVYNSLSRILAFSDQFDLLLSLMREDVRIVDELTSDPVTPTGTSQIEDSFYQWIRAARTAPPNVN